MKSQLMSHFFLGHHRLNNHVNANILINIFFSIVQWSSTTNSSVRIYLTEKFHDNTFIIIQILKLHLIYGLILFKTFLPLYCNAMSTKSFNYMPQSKMASQLLGQTRTTTFPMYTSTLTGFILYWLALIQWNKDI